MKQGSKVQKLAVSGVFIALASILSVLRLFELPYGGSVTPFSMLPIVMLAYMYGVRWGIASGAVYGCIQAILGATTTAAFADQRWWGVMLILFIDYILAFCSLSLAGIFKKKIKNRSASIAAGTLVATLLRYCCHIVSGCILFGGWAEWFFSQESTAAFGPQILERFSGGGLILVYSIIYNGTYMIPEIILTTAAAALIITVPPIRKELIKG